MGAGGGGGRHGGGRQAVDMRRLDAGWVLEQAEAKRVGWHEWMTDFSPHGVGLKPT